MNCRINMSDHAKDIIIYIIALLFLTTQDVKNSWSKIPTTGPLEYTEKVSQLLGTAYPQANYMAFCESISDNVADKGTAVRKGPI